MNKSAEDIAQILAAMKKFTFSGEALPYLCMIALILGLLIFFFRKEQFKRYLVFLVFDVVLYFVYMAGMCAMYLLSMPVDEALVLAGGDRYQGSIFLAFFYLAMAFSLEFLSTLENKKIFYSCYALLFACLILTWSTTADSHGVWESNSFSYHGRWSQDRQWFDSQIAQYHIPSADSCFIYNAENDSSFSLYLAKYLLTPTVLQRTYEITDPSEIENLDAFHYIFVKKYDNEILNGWIRENYPEQYGNSVIITGK